MTSLSRINTTSPRKWAAVLHSKYWNSFSSMKMSFLSQGSNQQYAIIRFDYGLAAITRPAIIWINDGLVFSGKYAPPGDVLYYIICALQWRNNERNGVPNHQPHDYLLKFYSRPRSKKPSKLLVTGLCEGNSPVTGEFPSQRTSNAVNVSIWWCHHWLVFIHA